MFRRRIVMFVSASHNSASQALATARACVCVCVRARQQVNITIERRISQKLIWPQMALRIGRLRSSALQHDGLDAPAILQRRTPQETNPKGHWGPNYFFKNHSFCFLRVPSLGIPSLTITGTTGEALQNSFCQLAVLGCFGAKSSHGNVRMELGVIFSCCKMASKH